MTLRLKLALSSGAVLFIVLGIFSLFSYRIQKSHLQTELKEQTSLLADLSLKDLITHMIENRGKDFQSHLERRVGHGIEEIRVFSASDGTILASSIPKEIGKTIYPLDLEVYRKDESPRVFEHTKNGRVFFSKIVPIYNDRTCHECHAPSIKVIGVLDIEVAEDSLDPQLSQLATTSAMSFAAILVTLVAVLNVITNRMVSRPLHDITSTIRRAQAGDLSIRYHTPRIDEIGKLANSLNRMLASLEGAGKEIERYHQDRLQRIERLANVGELATAITHELKNPLAGISGAVQVIAEELPPDDPKRQIIEEIQFQIARLDRTIRDLRNYARPPEPQFIFVNVNAVLEQSLRLVNTEVQSATVELVVNLGENLPDVELDPDMLQQAFCTLAMYCVAQMNNGGRLLITSRKRNEDRIEVVIEGAGGALVPETGEAIFRPLFKGMTSGCGLGLASSKGIIEQHRGIISAGPSPSGGVRFTVILPVSQKVPNG